MHPFALTLALLAAHTTAGEPAGRALTARKVLTCAWNGPQVVDDGVVLVKDGRIEAVGPRHAVEIPSDYELFDYGERWLSPGIVELHCHEAGVSLYRFVNDLNDTVFLVNPGVRASASAEAANHSMRMAIAGGVTTVLYIPGSGSNMGGQGVILKTPFETFEENLVRDPGSLKLAQWGNPESWLGPGSVGMSFENWNTRDTFRRGIEYAKAWERFEKGEGQEPPRDPMLDVFRDLYGDEIAVSTHTQVYQVVLMTITMVRIELGLPVFLDHSTIGGWLTGALAQEHGVPAIVGPRSVDTTALKYWARNKHEGFRGVAAGYQELGLEMVGFNTDSPVIPQEELSVNAAMGARYGMHDDAMQVLRGLTIVPARAAKIDDRVGSLEAGKDADILVVTGHPADPRTSIEAAWVDGRLVYEPERDGRRW